MNLARIDKDLKTILDAGTSYEIDPDVYQFQPAKYREERKASALKKLAKVPENISLRDFYTESSIDGYKIRLRTYQPVDFDRDKVILYFHGGGYVFGIPERNDEQMFRIAGTVKATIVSVDYRLTPEYRFPVPIQDGYDALTWTINNGAAVLNINPAAITLFGASAGGHLAAAMAQMAVDKQLGNIKHQILLYPAITNRLNTPSFIEGANNPLLNKRILESTWNHLLGAENVNKSIRYADLLNFDRFGELPRTTIIGAELDPLRDENIEYAQALFRAGVSTELWIIEGAVHVFDNFSVPLTERFYSFLFDKLK